MKRNKFAALLGALALAVSSSTLAAQNIEFTGGGADITFFYNSAGDSWVTTLRQKGTTTATGLTEQFDNLSTPSTWTGIVGNNGTNDFLFDSLTVNINTSTIVDVEGVDYHVSAASGSPFLASGTADLGIRTRLREDEFAMGIGANTAANQFDSFDLTLNLTASTFNSLALTTPGSPNVALLNWDAFDDPDAMIDTATNTLTANFNNYAHVHRNWGFSEYGDYSLVFDIAGVGGTYGATASSGTATINFSVIPEPSTALLLLTGLGAALLLRRRSNSK